MAGSRGSSTSGQDSRQQNGGRSQQDGKQGRTGQLAGDSLGRNDNSGNLSGDIRYGGTGDGTVWRSEEHTSELQSRLHLVCRLLLEKKKTNQGSSTHWMRLRQLYRAGHGTVRR